jgi:hypothetical protein
MERFRGGRADTGAYDHGKRRRPHQGAAHRLNIQNTGDCGGESQDQAELQRGKEFPFMRTLPRRIASTAPMYGFFGSSQGM